MLVATHLIDVTRAALTRFWRDERGASAVEYGLLAAILALGVYAATNALSGGISHAFSQAQNALDGTH